MPTISQLPLAEAIDPTDQIPVSQAGVSRSISIGALISSLQPALQVPTASLLGRTSIGDGGPEPVLIGDGLILQQGTLSTASGLLNTFESVDQVLAEDRLVIRREGQLAVVPVSALRSLYSAGQHVAIADNGTISAVWPSAEDLGAEPRTDIAALPRSASLVSTDLIPINRGGVDQATAYSTLLNAQTIDQAPVANAPSDEDLIWVGQGGNVMSRQSFSAIWNWVHGKLPAARRPVVEIDADVTLDVTVHNGRTLVCTHPVQISPAPQNTGDGFHCVIMNLSSGAVTFAPGVLTAPGVVSLPPRRTAHVHVVGLSSGLVTFVDIAGGGIAATAPGAVQSLLVTGVGSSEVTLSWLGPSTGTAPFTYSILYRSAGSGTWVSAATELEVLAATVPGLNPGSPYEFVVVAANAAGSGNMSVVVSATTQAISGVPGQPINPAATTQGPNSVSLSWGSPTSGGPVNSYTVQYRTVGATVWSGSASAVVGTSTLITALTPTTAYEFRILAANGTGIGPASATVEATTQAEAGAVNSIQWNMAPTGPYAHGTGSIGVNVLVTPADAAVRFGFSQSISTPPSTWTLGIHVMTNLWGAYVDTPATAGTWYAWAQGSDGSATTVHPASFLVQ